MVGVLIVTHGGMAKELLAASKTISGNLEEFEALSLEWTEGPEEARVKVATFITRLDHGEGVLVLTDLFGSTPSNVAMSLSSPGRVEVVAGVNLPMVVRLGCLKNRNMPLAEMAEWIRRKGRDSICWSGDLPAARREAGKAHDCSEDPT